MYYDARTAPLVTAEEAVEKADICCLLSDMHIGWDIYDLFYARLMSAGSERSTWVLAQLFGTIFMAGRMQGVRDERAKRRRSAARKAARSGEICERGPGSYGR